MVLKITAEGLEKHLDTMVTLIKDNVEYFGLLFQNEKGIGVLVQEGTPTCNRYVRNGDMVELLVSREVKPHFRKYTYMD